MAALVRINIHDVRTGAMFRAHGAEATRIMRDAADEMEEDAADWAEDQISRIYHESFRHPTGYYESHVHVSGSGPGLEIGDGGQAGPAYGPWLEGVGSRNAVTRFKGYHAFRTVTSMLERRFAEIGERILRRRAREL